MGQTPWENMEFPEAGICLPSNFWQKQRLAPDLARALGFGLPGPSKPFSPPIFKLPKFSQRFFRDSPNRSV
jgi:hypothetical protein